MEASATWRALGTSVHLLVVDGDVGAARAAVERVLADVDLAYSRFRPDSELVALNAAGGRGPQSVSPLLAQAIDVSIRAARQTAGAVDPTVGRAMRVIGYDDDFARIAGPDVAPRSLEVRIAAIPGWLALDFDARRRTVRIPSGVEIDLGSTGKALAADLAAAAAAEAAPGGGVLVSLGGDLAVAGWAPVGGWRVLAAEDSETPPGAEGEVVAIETGAIATSSTTVRRWTAADGTRLHHLIDPWTGGPVDSPWRTVTVVADTCVAANTAATATIVLADRGREWIEGTGLAARLVDREGTIVRVGGWPDNE